MKNITQVKIAIKRKLHIFSKFGYGAFGKNSVIYKPILIVGKKRIFIGKNVFFRNSLRMECISEHINQKFDEAIIEIGDNSSFEQGAHITSAGKLKIGINCVFLANTMITNIDHDYRNIGENVLKQDFVVKTTIIEDDCFIGMDVKIFPGSHIGKNSIIGANSIVMGDIPSYCVAVGCPAKVIKRYDHKAQKWVKV